MGWLDQAGAVGVGSDLLVDLEGEGEGSATGIARNAGSGAVAHGLEEVFDLEAQGFGFLEVELFQGETG
jgi:hypothetical protein